MADLTKKLADFGKKYGGYTRAAAISFAIVMSGAVTSFALEFFYIRLTTDQVPEGSPCIQFILFVIGTVAFIIFAGIGLRAVNRQQTSASITHFETFDTQNAKPEQRIQPRPALIMGFSPLSRPNTGKDLPWPDKAGFKFTDWDINKAMSKCGGDTFGNWQQPLRLIHRLSHRATGLTHVAILIGDQGLDSGTKEEDPPREYYERFVEMLNHYFKDRKIDFFYVKDDDNTGRFLIPGDRAASNYNNPEFVKKGVDAAHHQLAKKLGKSPGASEKQIFIDVTSGQATFSVNAAAYSFNRDIEIVYIGTGENSKNIYSFNTDLVIGNYQN